MADARPEIILTTDRTMMSNHHGKEFIGFIHGPGHRDAGEALDVDSLPEDEGGLHG